MMSASKFAVVLGVAALGIGILGFIPATTPDNHLLGIFEVDTLHNIVHVLTGVLALALAKKAPKAFLKTFGVVYLLVTIIGFIQHDTVLGLMNINNPDNWLHLVISASSLWFGFRKEGTA